MGRSSSIEVRTRHFASPSTRLAVIVLAIVLLVGAGVTWWLSTRNDWSNLSPSERETLAPLVYYWQDIPPSERKYYRAMAADAAQVPPEVRERLSRNLEYWHLLTTPERNQARAAYVKFRSLPEEERRKLIDRWEAEQAAPAEAPADPAAEGQDGPADAAQMPAPPEANATSTDASPAPADVQQKAEAPVDAKDAPPKAQ